MFDSIKILVLNYSYEPLQFCTAKRGIIMVLNGRAENLESNGYVVRSPSVTYPLPAVIRVLKMIRRNRKRGVPSVKRISYDGTTIPANIAGIPAIFSPWIMFIPNLGGEKPTGRMWWSPVNHVI